MPVAKRKSGIPSAVRLLGYQYIHFSAKIGRSLTKYLRQRKLSEKKAGLLDGPKTRGQGGMASCRCNPSHIRYPIASIHKQPAFLCQAIFSRFPNLRLRQILTVCKYSSVDGFAPAGYEPSTLGKLCPPEMTRA